jgi:hypothetical protein
VDADLRGHEPMEERAEERLQGARYTFVNVVLGLNGSEGSANLNLLIGRRVCNSFAVNRIPIERRIRRA